MTHCKRSCISFMLPERCVAEVRKTAVSMELGTWGHGEQFSRLHLYTVEEPVLSDP